MKPLQNPIVVGVLVLVALAFVFRSSFGPLRERFTARKTAPATNPPPAFAIETPTPVVAETNAPETNAPEHEAVWKRLGDKQREFLTTPKRDPFQFVPLPDSYRIVALSNAPSLSPRMKTAQEMLALN